MTDLKLASLPHSHIVTALGLDDKRRIIVQVSEFGGMMNMSKLASCTEILIIDSDHKIIKVK